MNENERNINPRGMIRPKSGIGGGVGMPGGRRLGRNIEPCEEEGPGYGKGEGKGEGLGRPGIPIKSLRGEI